MYGTKRPIVREARAYLGVENQTHPPLRERFRGCNNERYTRRYERDGAQGDRLAVRVVSVSGCCGCGTIKMCRKKRPPLREGCQAYQNKKIHPPLRERSEVVATTDTHVVTSGLCEWAMGLQTGNVTTRNHTHRCKRGNGATLTTMKYNRNKAVIWAKTI